jgi:hypothetical protein
MTASRGWTGGLFCEAGVNDTVRAAVTWDDGSGEALYVGGDFTIAGCETVNSIARWDGSNWSALTGPGGEGVNNIVSAMAVFDDGTGPALYVGGPFTTAGGMTVNRIARWDGTSWSALAGPSYVGVNNSVYAMAVFDDGSGPALFVAGDFTAAGGRDSQPHRQMERQRLVGPLRPKRRGCERQRLCNDRV